MSASSVDEIVRDHLARAVDESGGRPVPDMHDGLLLQDMGLDSLAFATVIARLEMTLGYDPFSLLERAYYPQTVREFIELYERFNDRARKA